jgi:hypothetical protein
VDSAEARQRVADILADDDPKPPEPAGDDGSVELPSLPTPALILLAAALVGISALVARRTARGAVLEREAVGGDARAAERTRAGDLSREADEAERRGDYAAAVRLRFQAGLARLDELGAIQLRPSLTATGAVRESGIGAIGGLAHTYERIAFGGRGASAADAVAQRTGWSAVFEEAKRKR